MGLERELCAGLDHGFPEVVDGLEGGDRGRMWGWRSASGKGGWVEDQVTGGPFFLLVEGGKCWGERCLTGHITPFEPSGCWRGGVWWCRSHQNNGGAVGSVCEVFLLILFLFWCAFGVCCSPS